MSYSKKLPDDSLIEITHADSYSGPNDCFSKLHCNSTVLFYRINNGCWIHTNKKSLHQARFFLELCENIKDVEGFFKED